MTPRVATPPRSGTAFGVAAVCALALSLASLPARAGAEGAGAASPSTTASDAPPAPVDDRELDPAEPDFNVINLPTGLRLPAHAFAFRLTHRFGRALGDGDFGDLAGDFFGFDGGARVGIGLRYGVTRAFQLGLYRTNERTIEFSGQYQLLDAREHAFGLALAGSVEGRDNFGEDYAPRAALVLSRRLGSRGGLYAVPAFIGNTRLGPDAPGDDATLMLGLGARLGLGRGMALLGEVSPRLAGYEGDADAPTHVTFGFEKVVGGHAFQLNFSNDLGTTPAQVARGRQGPEGWFIGFNLSRKFY